jgi:hypothetical protein
MYDILVLVLGSLDPWEFRAVAQTCRTLHVAVLQDLLTYDYWLIPYELGVGRRNEAYYLETKGRIPAWGFAREAVVLRERDLGHRMSEKCDLFMDFPVKIDQTDTGARSWWPNTGQSITYPLLPLKVAREEARRAKRRELSALLQELSEQ